MSDEPLPPMPEQFRRTQLAYADMISMVQDVVCGTRLTPPMALILAFVGDQIMSPADIRRYGYFIGTSLTFSLDRLEEDHLIERLDIVSDRRRRPVQLTPIGRRMAISIRSRLGKTAPTAAEVAL